MQAADAVDEHERVQADERHGRLWRAPGRRAAQATIASTPSDDASTIAFHVQYEATRPSGASASASSVNSGPYGEGRWCQFEKR